MFSTVEMGKAPPGTRADALKSPGTKGVARLASRRLRRLGWESDAGGYVNGTALGDVFRAAILDELEILDEARRQRPILAVVGLAARPTAGRVENLRRNAFELDRDIETEDRVGAVRHGIQLPGEGGIEERARVAHADALADAKRPARPSGIDQPAGDAVLQQARLQHFPVGIGMAHHERAAEAGAEGDFRFRAQADLGAGDLAGVPGKEVV